MPFPSSPSLNATYTDPVTGVVWRWDGTVWTHAPGGGGDGGGGTPTMPTTGLSYLWNAPTQTWTSGGTLVSALNIGIDTANIPALSVESTNPTGTGIEVSNVFGGVALAVSGPTRLRSGPVQIGVPTGTAVTAVGSVNAQDGYYVNGVKLVGGVRWGDWIDKVTGTGDGFTINNIANNVAGTAGLYINNQGSNTPAIEITGNNNAPNLLVGSHADQGIVVVARPGRLTDQPTASRIFETGTSGTIVYSQLQVSDPSGGTYTGNARIRVGATTGPAVATSGSVNVSDGYYVNGARIGSKLGISDGSNAAPGEVGEYLSMESIGTPQSLAVTAGDWDVSATLLRHQMDTIRMDYVYFTFSGTGNIQGPGHPGMAYRIATPSGFDGIMPIVVNARLRASTAGNITINSSYGDPMNYGDGVFITARRMR